MEKMGYVVDKFGVYFRGILEAEAACTGYQPLCGDYYLPLH